MKRTLLLLLLTLTAACHKYDRDAQLKALDEAYKSGVFTQEEYEAKKQAILGPPASTPAPAAAPAPTPAMPEPVTQPAIEPPPPAAEPQPAPAVAPPPRQQPVPVPVAPSPVAAPPVAPAPVPVPPPAAQAPAAQTAEPEPAPLAGCQDAESRAGGPGGVQQRFFAASEDVVRQAALRAFGNLDFVVTSSTGHQIEGSRKGRLNTVVGAGTERVILHFSNAHQNGQTGTKVTAETKRGIVGRVTQKPWTGAVLSQLACNLRGR